MNEKQSKLKPIKNKNELSAVKLKLLVTVVNRNKGELFADYIESKGVNMQWWFTATAPQTPKYYMYWDLRTPKKR